MHIHSEMDINIEHSVIYMSVNTKEECFNHACYISKRIDLYVF